MTEGGGDGGIGLILTGRVQGVGFRFFTRRRASELGVKGWVCNLPDGTVEVGAYGSLAALEELKRELRRGPAGSRVAEMNERPLGQIPEQDGFEITY